MKRLRYLAVSLLLVPAGAFAQAEEDQGWFGFGDSNEQQVEQQEQQEQQQEQEQVEDTDIKSQEQVDQQLQGDIQKQQDVERGETEVKYSETEKVIREKVKQEQIPTVKVCEEYADVNAMDEGDFLALGFDKQAAQKIVQKRQQQGRFNSVDELSQIEGVSQQTLAKVKAGLGAAPRQAQENQQQEQQSPEQQQQQQEAQQSELEQ